MDGLQVEMDVRTSSISGLGALIAHVKDTLARHASESSKDSGVGSTAGDEEKVVGSAFDVHVMGALVAFPIAQGEICFGGLRNEHVDRVGFA